MLPRKDPFGTLSRFQPPGRLKLSAPPRSVGEVDGIRSPTRTASCRRVRRGDREAPRGALSAGRRVSEAGVSGDRHCCEAAHARLDYLRDRLMGLAQRRRELFRWPRARSVPVSPPRSGRLDRGSLSDGDDPHCPASRRRACDAPRSTDARARKSLASRNRRRSSRFWRNSAATTQTREIIGMRSPLDAIKAAHDEPASAAGEKPELSRRERRRRGRLELGVTETRRIGW